MKKSPYLEKLLAKYRRRNAVSSHRLLATLGRCERTRPPRLGPDTLSRKQYWERLSAFYHQRDKEMQAELRVLAKQVKAAFGAFDAAQKKEAAKW